MRCASRASGRLRRARSAAAEQAVFVPPGMVSAISEGPAALIARTIEAQQKARNVLRILWHPDSTVPDGRVDQPQVPIAGHAGSFKDNGRPGVAAESPAPVRGRWRTVKTLRRRF